MAYLSVAVPVPLRQLFTYTHATPLEAGVRVQVAFGPRKLVGVVIDVIDEDSIPKEYYIKVVDTKLDKKRILEELKQGASIPGVRLVQKEYVRGLK